MPSSKRPRSSSASIIAEVGVAAALSVVLGKIAVYRMPQGGSVSLEMAPILFLAFYRGVRSGVLAGLVSGLAELFIGATIVHPVQAALDYPVAFAVLGLAPWLSLGSGVLRTVTGTIAATALRYLAHVVSGVVFFAQYAPEGTPVWRYSAVYNATFLGPKLLVSLVVVVYLMQRGAFSDGARAYKRRRR
ncbi:MAG: energy-coupled thiamine transporter ThiT [Clostridia bacterium]|nr:energy-coupled thiamine transporter ThiT [Clostridia bacterium]